MPYCPASGSTLKMYWKSVDPKRGTLGWVIRLVLESPGAVGARQCGRRLRLATFAFELTWYLSLGRPRKAEKLD